MKGNYRQILPATTEQLLLAAIPGRLAFVPVTVNRQCVGKPA
ncbi:MAG: hypothetical protein WAK31_04300 [Chthoniobacterales bacterium]